MSTTTNASHSGVSPNFDHHDASLVGDAYFQLYERFREQPVCRSDAHGGFWIVSRYDDVRAVLRDHATFSSAQGCLLPSSDDFRSLGLESDPPEHTIFRRLFLALAGRPAVEAAEPKLARLAARVVGDLARSGGGDAVSEISERLPVEAVALMAGLSDETAAKVRAMTVEMWKNLASDPEALTPLLEALMDEIAKRRVAPREDFLTALSNAEVDGRAITDAEIGNIVLSAVVAGHETTMNASSNLMLDLALHPALQAELRADASRIPQVVEESLRHRAPVHLFFRTVTTDTVFAGTPMAAGDKVAVLYASANRDPRQFERPDEFDPSRPTDRGHVAFGWGIHRCVGAPLAQAELRLLVEQLLAHGQLVLDGTPVASHLEGGHHMGWKELPLRLSPASG